MIKLLVVDDSPLMRRLMVEIFSAAGDFEIAIARNGEEALAQLAEFAADVVTLDITMPGMDGLSCLDRIMIERPCPVVMVSALTAAGADETLEAMALGAVDFIAKPKGAVSLHIDALAPDLVEKVRSAAATPISRTVRLRDRVHERVRARAAGVRDRQAAPGSRPIAAARAGSGVVLVGCSTGGPPALDVLLGELPADFPWPIVIAQHMPASFTGSLARRLDKLCALTVSEASSVVPLLPGHAYIGRGEADVVISRRNGAPVALAAPISQDHFWHPSVDRLVESAMRVIDPKCLIGVLMTGMGADGAAAMTQLAARGGYTIAEAAETAVVWGMPGSLVGLGGASCVRPLEAIAGELMVRLGR